jgi:hypothetical protein
MPTGVYIGIDVGNIVIPYWKPLTLVVENAAATHVVMTGSMAETKAVASDFTIAGFTVSSLARDATKKILTLTLSTSVVFGDTLSVVYKGKSYSVTNNVALNSPSGLTLSLISGGVKIDFTDNSGGIAQTEIWTQFDGSSSALTYTLAAGIVTKNGVFSAVDGDKVYVKIRALKNGQYSAFTSELNISLVGVEKIANGSFTNWTGNVPNSFAVFGDDGTHYFENSSGTARATNATQKSFLLYQNNILTITKSYRFKITISGITSGYTRISGDAGATGLDITTNGNKRGVVVAANVYMGIYPSTANTGICYDDFSVAEVLMP